MSISSSVDNKRAFFFLRNIGALIGLGYPLPTSKNLQSFTESYIASLELFKKSKNVPIEKTESQTWEILLKLTPEFYKKDLSHIFCAAIQVAPGSEEDAKQVFSCLQENQGIDLRQVYAGLYVHQLLEWMQNEVILLPLESTLFLLKIWRSFNSFTALDAKVWEELLSLPNWGDSQKETINAFKLKHDFLHKNSKYLQYVKLQSTDLRKSPLLPIKNKKENHKHYLNRYLLLLKAMQVLYQQESRREAIQLKNQKENLKKFFGSSAEILIPLFNSVSSKHEELSIEKNFFKIGSWEYHFLHNPKKISHAFFAWRAKNRIPFYKESMQSISNKLFTTLNFLTSTAENQKQLEKESGQFLSYQEMEKYLKERRDYTEEFEEGASNIELLGQEILDSLIEKQKEEPTQDQVALIEKNQRELIEEEEKFIASQNALKEPLVESSDSEVEESLQISLEQLPSLSFDLPIESATFDKIDTFLKTPAQVHGVLSKAVHSTLKQLKIYLLKINTLYELKVLQKEKVCEIHAHLVLATAAIEQIIQTVQDQRWNHVILGFRSVFIHCHFAVEQMLSLKILLEKKETATTHNLTHLAEKAEISITKERNAFLKDVAMHLWFCYPEDYQSFYPKNSYPKPFIFLKKLFYPYKAEGKLDVGMLKEALQLCFARYNQTIEFIVDISKSPKENLDRFLEKTKKVQQKILDRVTTNKDPNNFTETAILQKCNEVLKAFGPLNTPNFLLDFKERELLQRPLNTIKEYLQLMKRSLENAQKANVHSLQKFLQIEALANMDKLFKHLFRTIILLQTEEDNHSHNLSELFQLVENFYACDVVTEQDRLHLEKINLSITHHYLYKNSHVLLQKKYKKFFEMTYRFVPCSKKDLISMGKQIISYEELEVQKEKIHKELELSFDLFIKLLKPVVSELEQLSTFS